jgi:2Fe-2S ferredoxin
MSIAMTKLVVTTRQGETHTLDASIGLSVMEIIRDSGVDAMLALCGGACSCATCHVYVAPEYAEAVTPMSQDEDDLLAGSDNHNERSRLSCQIRMNETISGLHVTVAPED